MKTEQVPGFQIVTEIFGVAATSAAALRREMIRSTEQLIHVKGQRYRAKHRWFQCAARHSSQNQRAQILHFATQLNGKNRRPT
jgi:hypothetical protein